MSSRVDFRHEGLEFGGFLGLPRLSVNSSDDWTTLSVAQITIPVFGILTVLGSPIQIPQTTLLHVTSIFGIEENEPGVTPMFTVAMDLNHPRTVFSLSVPDGSEADGWMAALNGLLRCHLESRSTDGHLRLGAVFTTLDLAPDSAESDHCGACRACLDACPTAAFAGPYRLDARRCISYLTIEHKGHIAEEFREAMGNRIYGCDDCLAVCPWNKFAAPTRHAEFAPRADMTVPALAELAALDDAAFRARFAGSPVKRIGRDRFVRNVLIAVGNSGAPALVPTAERLADDPSPLVRAMAAPTPGLKPGMMPFPPPRR
jgi:ferredoxin